MVIDDSTLSFIREHRVARLATADASGKPHVVPICYVFEAGAFFSPIDQKPKSVPPSKLRRVRNISQNCRVSLVIDDYSEDWSRLGWVIVDGNAEMIEPGSDDHQIAVSSLRDKYPQYRAMSIESSSMIRIVPQHARRWQSQKGAI
jgi:PPOX class probable F420-dependent enzyme